MNKLVLNGLDGDNPLAFLASLGVVRILSAAWPDRNVRLGWQVSDTWHPYVLAEGGANEGSVTDAIIGELEVVDPEMFVLGDSDDDDKLKVVPSVFMTHATDAAYCQDRKKADLLAALSAGMPRKDGFIEKSLFCMMSAGQKLLGDVRILVQDTKADHIHKALFQPWDYSDDKPTMRWDPADYRQHALRWGAPSEQARNPIRTMRGANRLAVEGIHLFPAMPTKPTKTTGFRYVNKQENELTWPIWEPPLPVCTIKTTLSMKELQQDQPPRWKLSKRGVVEIYRCRRLCVNKGYGVFTQACPV